MPESYGEYNQYGGRRGAISGQGDHRTGGQGTDGQGRGSRNK
ncbi:hypothetical protein A1F94_011848 [Pyrenophora tritici-repentis]|nr:hypothetical protein PtrV1_00382 [Pyrenophora tritici-repentis]KAF7453100.1 hypothetical protein A1F99_003580 [Pyrenophora tritici-repentis]KAF7576158.1 hypothetical protein PtrM4_003980 [Pyrenophora tritici-repentis]KAG9377445.1 hypothetical protein A1F94_011848 [Pyrenophora tritici-repentis]KAI0569506.1 hypothetical protein Alg130_11618 [Pyrenophora tritici-repentis]